MSSVVTIICTLKMKGTKNIKLMGIWTGISGFTRGGGAHILTNLRAIDFSRAFLNKLVSKVKHSV